MQKLGWYRNKTLSDEEKNKKRQYRGNRYRCVSTKDKQKLKDYANNDAKYIFILKTKLSCGSYMLALADKYVRR